MPYEYGNAEAEQILNSLRTNGYTQEGVNRLYEILGLGPAPTVPAGLIGNKPASGRGAGIITDASGRRVGTRTGEIGNFLNLFGQQAVDPYRVPTGISQVAGGLLSAVGTAVGGPVWTGLTAAADFGNRALGNGSSASDLGRYAGIGALAGSLYNGLGGPGSYSANNPRVIDESGAMGGKSPNALGGGSMGWDWGRILDYGAPIIGGLLEGQGAKDAARASSAASAAGIAETRRQYDQTRADMMPWLQAGTSALGRLNDPNAFTASPDYNFRRTEGMRGIENSFAARGGALSGNALRALTDFNSGLAGSEYGNWWNRTASQAGLGQTTAQNLGSFGANNSANVANLLGAQGDARASGITGQTNALTGILQNLSSVWNRRNQGTYG